MLEVKCRKCGTVNTIEGGARFDCGWCGASNSKPVNSKAKAVVMIGLLGFAAVAFTIGQPERTTPVRAYSEPTPAPAPEQRHTIAIRPYDITEPNVFGKYEMPMGVVNQSQWTLSPLTLEVALYDGDGRFLEKDVCGLFNVRPGEEVTGTVAFTSESITAAEDWRWRLIQVSADRLRTKEFDIEMHWQ